MTTALAATRAAAATYRGVLAQPGLRALYAVGFAARLPLTATGVVLTLHVAVGLDRGFAAAGIVGGAVTLGTALGAPLLGRLIDRFGLRPVLALCGVSEVVFWGLAPTLDVVVLTITAFVAGVLALPAFPVIRQSLGAEVPGQRRRPAFALDAMSAEVSFIVGPALGTAAVLALPPAVALSLVGACFVLATAGLWWLDPPTRTDGDRAARDAPAPPLRGWLRTPMVVALTGAAAAVLLLSATELAVVAALSARGETAWFALANSVWCLASLVGGFLHGVAARPLGLPTLLGALAVGTVPVAFGGPWWLVTLLVVPAGAFCAPALSSSAEAVGRLAPDAARGVATGLHGSAIMGGAALAQPLTGALIDRVSPTVALLVAVGVCLLVALGARVGLGRGGGGETAAVPRHDPLPGRAPRPVTEKSLAASRVVDATPDRVFALLSTPDRHPDLDASGTVRGTRTHRPIRAVGDVFVMEMHGADMGDYLVDNHVVAFEPDREIAWAPATHGGDRGGQVWTYRLEPADGGGCTRVTHVYDWSGVTLERLLPYLPVVDADGLAATLERLREFVEPD